MGIDWAAFSWEAFATLVTGLAAVGAAWRVGSRQMKILSRQNELKEQELRTSLLQERLDAYDAVHTFLREVCYSGRLPQKEVIADFNQARTKARFLFSDEVNETIKEISIRSQRVDFQTGKTGNIVMVDDDGPNQGAQAAEADMIWLVDTLTELHEKFAEIAPQFKDGKASSQLSLG